MGLFQWFRCRRYRTRWQHYNVQPFEGPLRLKDGSEAKLNDHVMRRRLADGLWEYRLPTQEEADLQWKADQW